MPKQSLAALLAFSARNRLLSRDSGASRTSKRQPLYRPRLELLEDRTLLAASFLADFAGLSLSGDDTAGNSPSSSPLPAGVSNTVLIETEPVAGPFVEVDDSTGPAPSDEPSVASGQVAVNTRGFSLSANDDKLAFFDDAVQGQRDTCVFMSVISAVALTNFDLHSGIALQSISGSSATFQVRLFKPNGQGGFTPDWRTVTYDGYIQPQDARPTDNGEIWVALYEKAYLQQQNDDPNKYRSSLVSFQSLTGVQPQDLFAPNGDPRTDAQRILTALNGGNPVIATTTGSLNDPGSKVLSGSDGLIRAHAYTVMGVELPPSGSDGIFVTIRNPWGRDTHWSVFDTNSNGKLELGEWNSWQYGMDGNNDGIIRISWQKFAQFFKQVRIGGLSGPSINQPLSNQKPVFANPSVGPFTIREGQTLGPIDLSATDPEGEGVDYLLKGGSPGVVNLFSGQYTWEPLSEQAGTYLVTVVASTSPFDSVTQTFQVTVLPGGPHIDSLTSSVGTITDSGTDPITITAHDVTTPVGSIARVEFYLDRNGNGKVDDDEVDADDDDLLFRDENGADGWSWSGFLPGVTPGTAKVVARAVRFSFGSVFYSPSVAVPIEVVAGPPRIPGARPQGAETRINNPTSGTQSGGHVTLDGAGNLYGFWTSAGEVYVQRYDPAGVAQGLPIPLDNPSGIVDVDMLSDGHFMVFDGTYAWEYRPDFSVEVGYTVHLSTHRGGRIDYWAPGNFVGTVDEGQYFSEQAYYRVYEDGEITTGGGNVRSWTGESGITREGDVARLADGNLVVTFVHAFGSGPMHVKAFLAGPDGFPLNYTPGVPSSYITLSTRPNTAALDQGSTSVAALPGGGFVVAWGANGDDPFDPDYPGIYVRRFSANGTPIDPIEVLVNDVVGGSQVSPRVEVAADGSYVVTWNSGNPVTGLDVFAQVFRADGTKRGANFSVNTTVAGAQTMQYAAGSLAVRPDGSFVVGWQGAGPGDSSGTFLQRFQLNPNDAPVAATAHLVGVKGHGIAIDLRTLVSDEETTDKNSLTFKVNGAVGGKVQLLGDGHTAWFTPGSGFTGAAQFTYQVRDLPVEGWAALTSSNTVTLDVLPVVSDDGDRVKVSLVGPGKVAVVVQDPDGDGLGPIQQIVLSGTKADSKLVIQVTPAGGDGIVSIGAIKGGTIGSIMAPDVNLNGDGVVLTGGLGRLRIRDLVKGADVRAGGGPTQGTVITAASLGDDTTIDVHSTLEALTADHVARAMIRAPAMTSLMVVGDFFGDLVLTGRAGSSLPTLGTASIGGQLVESTWQVTGRIGTITALSHLITDWTLSQQGGGLKALRLGDVGLADVTVAERHIGSIKARNWLAGQITAASLGSLDIEGEFGADVDLTG